jgi:hypothetical protein
MTRVQLYRLMRLVQAVHVAQLIVDQTEAQRRLPDISSAQQAGSLGAHELVHFGCIDPCLAPYPLRAGLIFFSEFVFLKLALKVLRSYYLCGVLFLQKRANVREDALTVFMNVMNC